ncbi:MAG: hypothetical protein RRA94_10680, partial [Bacteroidota bacterium]|nr:hypothetical protein [Bacteroidota bacterium]
AINMIKMLVIISVWHIVCPPLTISQSKVDANNEEEMSDTWYSCLWFGTEYIHNQTGNYGVHMAYVHDVLEYDSANLIMGVKGAIASGYEYAILDGVLYGQISLIRLEAGISLAHFMRYPHHSETRSSGMGPPTYYRDLRYFDEGSGLGSKLYYILGLSLVTRYVALSIQYSEQLNPSLYTDIDQRAVDWGETTFAEWTEGPSSIQNWRLSLSLPIILFI